MKHSGLDQVQIRLIIDFLISNKVYDLVEYSYNEPNVIYLNGFGKFEIEDGMLYLFELKSDNEYIPVPMLNVPIKYYVDQLDQMLDSSIKKLKNWIDDLIFDLTSYCIFKVIGDERDYLKEFIYVNQILKIIRNSNDFVGQKLLSSDGNTLKEHASYLRDIINLFKLQFPHQFHKKAVIGSKKQEQFRIDYLENLQSQSLIKPTFSVVQRECLMLSEGRLHHDLINDCEYSIDTNQVEAPITKNKSNSVQCLANSTRFKLMLGDKAQCVATILQIANLNLLPQSKFLYYISEVLQNLNIENLDYNKYADAISIVYRLVTPLHSNGFENIISIAKEIDLIGFVLDKIDDGFSNDSVHDQANKYIVLETFNLITKDFDILVSRENIDTYRCENFTLDQYVGLIDKPLDIFQVDLYEKCLLLVGDTSKRYIEHEDLELWFVNIGSIKVLGGRIISNDTNKSRDRLFFTEDIGDEYLKAVEKIIDKIRNQRNKTA